MGWLKNPTGVCGYILGVRDFVHTNNELDLCVDSGKYISVDLYNYFLSFVHSGVLWNIFQKCSFGMFIFPGYTHAHIL